MQGSQGPWPVDSHKSILPEQPNVSTSSLVQQTIPVDAPGGLRAVPVRCGEHRAGCLAREHLLLHTSDFAGNPQQVLQATTLQPSTPNPLPLGFLKGMTWRWMQLSKVAHGF